MSTQKVLVTLAFLASASLGSFAQTISSEEALHKALDFYAANLHSARAKSAVTLTLAHEADVTDGSNYYVFNRNTDAGFIIINGNTNGREILGYSYNGHFDYAAMPENMKWWLSQFDVSEMTEATETPVTNVTKQAKAPTEIRESIAPLMTIKWNQTTPFNDSIPRPESAKSKFVTGCVATATAQVMGYYKYPEKGIGSHSYTKKYNGEPFTFSADFGNTTYDWANILDTYKSGSYNTTQRAAIAQLMYHVGVSLDMNYNTQSSSTSARIPAALVNHFGYDKSIRVAERKFYTDEEWADILYAELKAGRPIIYSGYDLEKITGHEFVFHGYDAEKDMWAVNWGWGGSYNGFFPINGGREGGALYPYGTKNATTFCDNQAAVIYCMPDAGNDYYKQVTITTGFTFYVNSAKATSANIGTTNPQLHYYSYGNYNSATPSYLYFSAAFRNVETGELVYADESLSFGPEVPAIYQWGAKVPFRPTNIKYNGEYVLVPLFRCDPSEEWRPILIPIALEMPHIYVTGRQKPSATDITNVTTAGNSSKRSSVFYNAKTRSLSILSNNRTYLISGQQVKVF